MKAQIVTESDVRNVNLANVEACAEGMGFEYKCWDMDLNAPKFRGLYGPFKNGPEALRYESKAVYLACSI